MRNHLLFLVIILSGCSSNYSTETFIYQDTIPEKQINLEKIQTDLKAVNLFPTLTEVSLATEDNITLHGIKLMNTNAKINIVIFGANGMKINASSKILNHFSLVPANIIWFDYRGMGASDKKDNLAVEDLQSDAISIVDFAKQSLPKDLPLAIHGLSMGSLVAGYVSNNANIDALILDGAISNVPDLVDNLVPSWMSLFYTINISTELAVLSNIDFIKNNHKPLLLLVGEDDTVTPPKNSQLLYQLSPSKVKTLIIIPDSTHSLAMKTHEAIQAYQALIQQLN